jgi:hypothetical protein
VTTAIGVPDRITPAPSNAPNVAPLLLSGHL